MICKSVPRFVSIPSYQAYKDGNVKLFVSLASSKLPDVGERSEKLKDVCKIVKEQLINLDQNKVVLDHVANWKDIRKSGEFLVPISLWVVVGLTAITHLWQNVLPMKLEC